MRWRVKCKSTEVTIRNAAKPCGYEWETSGEQGADLAIADHLRAYPEHECVKEEIEKEVS